MTNHANGPGAPADASWHGAWTAALDELEMNVDEITALLETDHANRERPIAGQWHPPAGLGPLPLDLRPRADAILARQAAAAEMLARALATNRRQATLAAKLESGDRASTPAYVDCAA